jgi:hypothetical protein
MDVRLGVDEVEEEVEDGELAEEWSEAESSGTSSSVEGELGCGWGG